MESCLVELTLSLLLSPSNTVLLLYLNSNENVLLYLIFIMSLFLVLFPRFS